MVRRTKNFFKRNRHFECSEKDLAARYGRIDKEVDVLLSHPGPRDCLDAAGDASIGSSALLDRIKQIHQLALHDFGHVDAAHVQPTGFERLCFVAAQQ